MKILQVLDVNSIVYDVKVDNMKNGCMGTEGLNWIKADLITVMNRVINILLSVKYQFSSTERLKFSKQGLSFKDLLSPLSRLKLSSLHT